MIDTAATARGGIKISIGGNSEEMDSAVASAFISSLLAQMQQQAEKIGDNRPDGGAIVYPDSCAIDVDRQTGDPRLRLRFGKALLVVSLPAGEMKKLGAALATAKI